jgi:sirohydrochlorin cobaltochelatase
MAAATRRRSRNSRRRPRGFLEFARPIIREGLDALRERGVTRILAVPGMLFAAGHAKDDIPSVLNTYQARYEGVKIQYGRELAIDPKLLRVAATRIEEAERQAGSKVSRAETCLLVVGRGTSDPDANSNVTKVARMLWEGMGFGWTETCFSGVAFPLVGPGLEHAVRLGYKRIIVFPYFLFTGALVKRIYGVADAMAQRHPEIEIVKAGYLKDHPLVLDVFAERVEEILAGENKMNCQLCKYRVQVLGHEAEVGRAQESHHHHVEGIGTDPVQGHDHPHDHGHDHDHDHDHAHGNGHHHGTPAPVKAATHTHFPPPFPDHPHGPGRRDPESL